MTSASVSGPSSPRGLAGRGRLANALDELLTAREERIREERERAEFADWRAQRAADQARQQADRAQQQTDRAQQGADRAQRQAGHAQQAAGAAHDAADHAHNDAHAPRGARNDWWSDNMQNIVIGLLGIILALIIGIWAWNYFTTGPGRQQLDTARAGLVAPSAAASATTTRTYNETEIAANAYQTLGPAPGGAKLAGHQVIAQKGSFTCPNGQPAVKVAEAYQKTNGSYNGRSVQGFTHERWKCN